MKKITGFLYFVFFSFGLSSAGAFSAKDILSPIEGQWVNVQPLVINASDESEIYYSLTGEDPLVSGFAYDGPVVIDEIGNIKVRIASLSKDGKRSDYTVNYSVKPESFSTSNSDTAFLIQTINSNPILKYSPKTEFYIPEDFYYSLNNSLSMQKGQKLFINKNNLIEHYVPCTLNKGSLKWHFVIKVAETSSEEKLVSRLIPFNIDNWTDFTYTGENLIYQIDDEYWTASREKIILDRNIPHTIRWQSIDYKEGNPVSEYYLPPQPVFTVKNNEDSSLTLLSSDSSFKFNGNSDNLYKSVSADTFFGNTLNKSCTFKVYCDNVYQGNVKADFYVDREKPLPPLFSSSSNSSFARNEVSLKINALEEECKIFYSVSEPLESDKGFEEADIFDFSPVNKNAFTEYSDKEIILKPLSEKASYFKVTAYCKDKAGNISDMAEHNVIIDKYNYYLRPSSDNSSSVHDGSYANPFTTFEEALSVINSRKATRLHVSGDIHINQMLSIIEKDCTFICSNARFILAPQASIKINFCNVKINGCIIERNDESSRDGELPLISLEKSKLSLDNVEISGVYISDGILINAKESEIDFINSGLTVYSQSYASCLASSDSKVNIENCRITSSAPNCVNLTLHSGKAELLSNSFYLTGRTGHCLEFSSSDAYVDKNTFNLNLSSKKTKDAYIWQDLNTKMHSLKENIILTLD